MAFVTLTVKEPAAAATRAHKEVPAPKSVAVSVSSSGEPGYCSSELSILVDLSVPECIVFGSGESSSKLVRDDAVERADIRSMMETALLALEIDDLESLELRNAPYRAAGRVTGAWVEEDSGFRVGMGGNGLDGIRSIDRRRGSVSRVASLGVSRYRETERERGAGALLGGTRVSYRPRCAVVGSRCRGGLMERVPASGWDCMVVKEKERRFCE